MLYIHNKKLNSDEVVLSVEKTEVLIKVKTANFFHNFEFNENAFKILKTKFLDIEKHNIESIYEIQGLRVLSFRKI